jgi:hypothetical protein
MRRFTFDEVRAFTIAELWDLPGGLTEQTALAHDLRIGGLDAKEFMEKYASRFDVALGNFDWIKYFGSEGLSPLAPIALVAYLWQRYVRGMSARDLETLPELTLGHLLECANRGHWTPPEQTA